MEWRRKNLQSLAVWLDLWIDVSVSKIFYCTARRYPSLAVSPGRS